MRTHEQLLQDCKVNVHVERRSGDILSGRAAGVDSKDFEISCMQANCSWHGSVIAIVSSCKWLSIAVLHRRLVKVEYSCKLTL